MRIKYIVELFENGNVSVFGLRGKGKDMLTANVVIRRNKPYVCNTNYGGQFYPLDLSALDAGGNSYKNFLSGNINYYEYPYPPGTDVYISDAGIYFPSQFCNELNRDYKNVPTLLAISRHLGFNFHFNVQALHRMWDKFREQSDTYICCNQCFVFLGIVFQQVTFYDKYESADNRVPPFPLRMPILNPTRRFLWETQKANYLISHGNIERRWLIYKNKSSYNSFIFKEMLKNGKKKQS